MLLCINHNCYLYMPSWGPDLVNKLILFYSILYITQHIIFIPSQLVFVLVPLLPLFNLWFFFKCIYSAAITQNIWKQLNRSITRGGSRGEGGGTLKLEKIWFFGVNTWFFTRYTQTNFAPPSARRNFFKCPPP